MQAYKRFTIYKYIQKEKVGSSPEEHSHHVKNSYDNQLLISLQREIVKNDFFSVHSLTHNLNVQPSLIYRYLTQRLNYAFKKTKWVPHTLNLM